jgi:hypothetical protein
VLPDSFVDECIIAKLPATSLKHKRQEFSIVDLIDSLENRVRKLCDLGLVTSGMCMCVCI